MTDDEMERLAQEHEGDFTRRRRRMEDFRYDERQEKYWDITTGHLLGAKSIDGAIPRGDWPTRPDGRNGELRPYPPSRAINDIDTGLTVEDSTWWPGKPQFMHDIVVSDNGALRVPGAICYNTYRRPCYKSLRKDGSPQPWLDHVARLFPDRAEQEHFFNFAAHVLQRPDEKLNHGLVMAGAQGIGKDTALVPLRRGVGEGNAQETGSDDIMRPHNGFVRSVLLTINEVRPHDEDFKASNFYGLLKPYLAAPPEMLPMNLKYANTIYVRNLCHVILTTNDPLTMYIPSDDRRLFVMTSPLPDPKVKAVFDAGYFNHIYAYLEDDGADAVILWLLNRDISKLAPGEPPPMTAGKRAIIESAHQIRRSHVDDLFDAYCDQFHNGQTPEVIFHADLSQYANSNGLFDDMAAVRKALSAKNFHFKMNERGYDMWKNPAARSWRNGRFESRTAFVSRDVPPGRQLRLIELELQRRPLEMTLAVGHPTRPCRSKSDFDGKC